MPAYSKYYDEAIETMARPDLERLQEGLLLQLLPYAYGRSALTREVWDAAGVKPSDIRSLADFHAKAPFIDKDRIRHFRDTRNDPYGGLKCLEAPHLIKVGFTSGTTGDPTPVPQSRPIANIQTTRDYWHMGVRPGDYISVCLFTFRAGHLTTNYTACDFKPLTYQHSPSELPRLFADSINFRPTAMMVLSTPLIMAIEDHARKHDTDLRDVFSSYKGAIYGGEAPPPRVRKLMMEWDLEMYEITSLGDVIGAIDCSAHAGFHAWEDLALVEVLDPDGDEPVADGERGELVVTSLQDDAAPLVRFRTDDLVTFTRERCLCGRTHGRIQVLGRKGDELVIDGKSLLPRDINPLLEEFPETLSALYQVIRTSREMDILRLRIGYNPAALWRSESDLKELLRATISSALEVPVAVELTPNAELLKLGPPHKIPRVTKQ
jgi:phenylacetate-CoA ligase